MKKILLIDPVGRSRGMERWHRNFFSLASRIFDISIFGNYSSDVVSQKFIYDKEKKPGSIASIIKFTLAKKPANVDSVILAHYGESLNTLLFLPAILRYKKNKRHLLIHDAVSTLKNERKGLRSRLGRFADKLVLNSFDNLIVHNLSVSSLFPDKKVLYIPLPPTTVKRDVIRRAATGKFIFWGFIKRSKNVEFVIDLAANMPHRTFDIYGTFINEEYKAAFNERVKKLPANNLHFFESFIPEEKVEAVLQGYDAVLMPYTFITNSGILQTNADYCTISVTSDLPAFRVCEDISINLPLDVSVWKERLDTFNSEKIYEEKKRIVKANEMRANEFIEGLKQLGAN